MTEIPLHWQTMSELSRRILDETYIKIKGQWYSLGLLLDSRVLCSHRRLEGSTRL